MRILPPCKGCPRKAVGCHTGCEGYQAYKARVEAQNAAKQAAAAEDRDVAVARTFPTPARKKVRRKRK